MLEKCIGNEEVIEKSLSNELYVDLASGYLRFLGQVLIQVLKSSVSKRT